LIGAAGYLSDEYVDLNIK
jgi:adenosine kinase